MFAQYVCLKQSDKTNKQKKSKQKDCLNQVIDFIDI